MMTCLKAPARFCMTSAFSTLIASTSIVIAACGESLPEDVADYRTDCIKLNAAPIQPYSGDPHKGEKDVFACNVSRDFVEANTRPFPDGTLIVKESSRVGEDFPWLMATARKQGGGWQWDEYTRNFADEDFERIAAGQSVCTDCHQQVRDVDWIFTFYAAP